jgi:hypothetical protein
MALALAARSAAFTVTTLGLRRGPATKPLRTRPATATRAMGSTIPDGPEYTIPDQPARFAKDKAAGNARVLTTVGPGMCCPPRHPTHVRARPPKEVPPT